MSLRAGVIGAGVMGSGIAQSLATGGIDTVCTDISRDALASAREQVQTGRFGFERAIQRGKLSQEDAEAAFARLTFTDEFDAAANTDVVIECVPERLDLKVRIFRDLDAAAPESSVLASNSSGFPIAALSAATERPTRVIGWHWASPPVIMRFAEIVVTQETDPAVVRRVEEAARACGKNPIVVQDAPMAWGYVANRVYFAMLREAQRVVDEGVASPEQVNALMVDCYNWPVGPFAMIKGAGSGWQ
ncbi:MAG: 3-hydroxyacyl-CoA dehydrogenase family protein [Deltaproteobacteria bacterium]|nr:3-hydroxyacyl-CoA dehydrogenase family protein [Deltaproteobacteria bacterium]MBW2361150.1 3-hydroxyacyl-CoA dehydrogenase family protein [Deltaproteobacteria bacterium]